MKKVEKVSFYSRYKTAILIVVVLAVGITFLGTIGYIGFSYKHNQQLKEELREATEKANSLGSKKETIVTPQSQQSTPPTQNVTSPTTQSQSVAQKNQQTTNNTAATPQVKESCSYDYNSPKFKTVYIKGSSFPRYGTNGTTKNCTYSDGRAATSIIETQAIDEIRYVNVTTADYSTALYTCRLEPAEYIEACAQVVMQQ